MLHSRKLIYINEIVRCGSIRKAAARLNVASSAVNRQILALEEELGAPIFERLPKGLRLTAAGERAIVRTIRLLADAEAFVQDLRSSDARLSGVVRVGCFTSIAPNIAPQVIRALLAAHPDVTVHLVEGDIVTIQKFLRDGAVDLLLTYDAGLSDEFDHDVLATAPPHLVLAEGHRLAQRSAIELRDLSSDPLLLLNLPQSRTYILSLFEQAGVQPGPIQRLESFEMVRGAAAAGLGVAILNIRPPSDLTYSGMRVLCRPLVAAARSPSIVIATRKGGRISRRAEAFWQCCRDFFATEDARQLFLHPAGSDQHA